VPKEKLIFRKYQKTFILHAFQVVSFNERFFSDRLIVPEISKSIFYHIWAIGFHMIAAGN